MRIENSQEGLVPLFECFKESPSSKDLTFDEYIESCSKFDCLTIFDDSPVGVVFFDDNKVAHIAIKEEYRGKCWDLIFKAIDYARDEYGEVYGACHERDLFQRKFIEMLGFKEIGRKDGFIVYEG